MTERASRPKRRSDPATTVVGRENQLISLAVDLVERQLQEGTASAQVITHYLKLGTERERLERERLENENRLLQARVEDIEHRKQSSVDYEKVLEAFRSYKGSDALHEYND